MANATPSWGVPRTLYVVLGDELDIVTLTISLQVGGIMNDKEMQAEGTAQHKSGETQTKVAEFVGTAQGAYDQAAGKVNNLIGSFTGDSTQQAQGLFIS